MTGHLREGSDLSFGCDDHDLHVVAILGHEQITGTLLHGDVVDSPQGRALGDLGVVDDPVGLGSGVDGVHTVVALGGEHHRALGVPDALTAGEHGRPGDLVLGRQVRGRGVRNSDPADLLAVDHRSFEGPGAQVRIRRRRVAVEPTVGLILGEIDDLVYGVHRRCFMLEQSHGGEHPRFGDTGGVGLVDPSGHGSERGGRRGVAVPVELLTRQPGTPWGGATRAVDGGVTQDPVGIGDLAPGIEAHRGHTAGSRKHGLAVGHVDPTVVVGCKGGTTIGEHVPGVAGVAHRLIRRGDDPAGEALRQQQAVGVGNGGFDRSVGPGSRYRTLVLRCAPHARRDHDRANAERSIGEELSSLHPSTLGGCQGPGGGTHATRVGSRRNSFVPPSTTRRTSPSQSAPVQTPSAPPTLVGIQSSPAAGTRSNVRASSEALRGSSTRTA